MKSKLLLIPILAVILIFMCSVVTAQTVHQVAAGTDVLKPAIDAAAAGDIIELTTSGGAYLSADQIVLTKDVTIRAHQDLEQKPVLKYVGTSTGAYMFKVEQSPKVMFKAIEFDGDGTAEGGAALAKYALRLDNVDTLGTMDVRVMDCVLHDFTDKIIKPYANCGIDSLIVHNSIFYNGAREGVTLYSGSSANPAVRLKYAEFENCTFYNFVREGIKADTNPNTVMRVNHCTFYDCGGTGKGMLYVDDLLDVEVKNSIFVTNGYGTYFARFESAANIFKNIVFYDVATHTISSGTVTDTLFADPVFADAANGDFTLDLASPALGYGDDGNAAGDIRWDPTALLPKVYKIESGTDVIKPILDAAAAGDTLELVSSGGNYLSADQMVINKDIVIRARANLAQKPILKYIGTSTGAYMFKVVESPKVKFIGLEFDGDGTAEGGAALAKYAMRLDNVDTLGTMDVRVMDCVLHDFTDKIIKPYANCGIDSLIVHNSIFYNGAREGVTLYSGSSANPAVRLKYAEFENCTFYNFVREGIKADTNPNTVMRVNHCTFYDCGGTGKGMLYVDDLLDVEVKNSIFVTNGYGTYFARFESAANIFKNIVFYDVATHTISSGTVTDTLFADPLFADVVNGDFTLDAFSPARTAGEGNTPAGDLRWAIDPNKKIVSVVTEGNGIVTLDPPGGIYDPATTVTLTAIPDLGWEFEMWSGIIVFPPDKNPATITVNDNMTVTAKFKNLKPQVTLTIDSVGLGQVSVDPVPGDDETYDQGSTVSLTATPAANWEFVEWLGDITGTDNPVDVVLDSNMTVIASFRSTFTQFSLDITTAGKGSVMANPEPVIDTYDTATVVILTANADLGWEFAGWSGDMTGMQNPDTVQMDSNITLTVNFSEITVVGGVLEVDTTWDLRDAVEFANNNSQVDTIMLTTSGGLYTTTSTDNINVMEPLTVMAKEGLEVKPTITISDPEKTNDDIFRVFNDFTLIGVIMDGGHPLTHGPKYGIRLRHYTADSVKTGTNVKVMGVDFYDFFEDKNPKADGHPFKIDVWVKAGDILFEDCFFKSTGYEAIRISDTEKWPTDAAVKSLTVRNCTFTDIDAECVRYYSDLDAGTPDAPVLIEHLTINNSATRTMYLKNSGGAIVRDIIISNSRTSGHGRDNDLMDAQGNTDVPSFVSHIDTFRVKPVPIKSTDGTIDSTTIFGFDPLYEDPVNFNYTLLGGSELYGISFSGLALGDLNWADSTLSAIDEFAEGAVPLRYSLEQNYPNPFNPSTKIKFSLKKAGKTTLKVYDVLGREVAVLVNEEMTPGTHVVDFYNTKLATGLYFYQIKSGNFIATKKMLMIK